MALRARFGIGKISLGRTIAGRFDIHSTIPNAQLGSTGRLDGTGGCHLVQVRITDGRELFLDGDEKLVGASQSRVCSVKDLGLEANGCYIRKIMTKNGNKFTCQRASFAQSKKQIDLFTYR